MSYYTIKVKSEVARCIEIMKAAGTLFDRFVEWKTEGDESDMAHVFNALTEHSNDISQLLQDILTSEVKIEVEESRYIVILEGINFGASGTHWRYVALEPTMDGNVKTRHTDFKRDIETFTQAQLGRLPRWAQNLAEEV